MIDKQKLIENTVRVIKTNNGQLNYSDIEKALIGQTIEPPEIIATFYQMMAVICHNIPYYDNGIRKIREVQESFRDAITFYNANKAEGEIVNKSATGIFIDDISGFVLPKFSFGDNTHYIFKSGTGVKVPDLLGSDGFKYEVKRNYINGSRSSLHRADYLIDCKNTTIEVRKINNNVVDLAYRPLARFNGFLSNKIVNPIHNLDTDTFALIESGELIPIIEKRLQEDGFCWNI